MAGCCCQLIYIDCQRYDASMPYGSTNQPPIACAQLRAEVSPIYHIQKSRHTTDPTTTTGGRENPKGLVILKESWRCKRAWPLKAAVWVVDDFWCELKWPNTCCQGCRQAMLCAWAMTCASITMY